MECVVPACALFAGSSTDYEPQCGRPHGVRLDRHGQLIVADSYLGLYSVDPKTGEKTLLVANAEGELSLCFCVCVCLPYYSVSKHFFFGWVGGWGGRAQAPTASPSPS